MAADSHTWQNGGVNTLWDTVGNWDPAEKPADGDTCIYPDGPTPPTGNYPASGTFNVTIDGSQDGETLSEFIGEACTVGNVIVQGGSALGIDRDLGAGKTLLVTGADSLAYPDAAVVVIPGLVTVAAGATLEVDTNTLQADSGVSMAAGTTLQMLGGTLDTTVLSVSGSGALTIVWDDGAEIQGRIDCQGQQIIHNTGGLTPPVDLTLDQAGNLDLGTDGAGGPSDWSHVQVADGNSGNKTLVRSCKVYGFTKTAASGGTSDMVFGVYTMTVHAGGVNFDGTGSVTGGKIIFADDTAVCTWNDSSYPADLLTISAGVTATLSNYVRAKAITGAGVLDLNSTTVILYPASDNFWTLANACLNTGGSANGYVQVNKAGTFTNAAHLNLGVGGYQQAYNISRVNAPGGLTCKDMVLKGSVSACFLDMAGGVLSAASIVLGSTSNHLGRLDLGERSHVVTGNISKLGTGAQVLNLETSRLACGGDITLAGIAVNFGAASISVTGTLDGTTATSIAAKGAHVHGGTVDDLAADADNPVYRFGGTGDAGNGAGVIQMPAPTSGACAGMVA